MFKLPFFCFFLFFSLKLNATDRKCEIYEKICRYLDSSWKSFPLQKSVNDSLFYELNKSKLFFHINLIPKSCNSTYGLWEGLKVDTSAKIVPPKRNIITEYFNEKGICCSFSKSYDGLLVSDDYKISECKISGYNYSDCKIELSEIIKNKAEIIVFVWVSFGNDENFNFRYCFRLKQIMGEYKTLGVKMNVL